MTAFLQFDSRMCDENAKKALGSYVEILQEALKHYHNLLDSYIKLQEEHKQCSNQQSSKVDQPCTHIKEELLSQEQLNTQDIKQENNSILPELDISYPSDMSPCKKQENNIRPMSPIICRTYLNNPNTLGRDLTNLPELVDVHVCDNSTPNAETYHSNKEVKCNSTWELSTSQHVETTFLPGGKKLKQPRLIFKKVPSTSANQPASADVLPRVQQTSREDASVPQVFTAADSNTASVNETVIDISPPQRNVVSKLRRCLQLKRKKLPSRYIKYSPKKKNNSSDRKDVIPILTVTTDTDTDSGSCTPEDYSTQIEEYKPFIKSCDTVVNMEDKDDTLASPLVEINNMPDVQIISPDKAKKTHQLEIDKLQCASENKNNCSAYEEETFCFSVEQSMNRDTDDPSLDDTENKPPVKKSLLTSSRKNKDVPERLNTRWLSDKAKLRGRDCWECEEYYKNLALPKEELQKRKNYCSRHRDMYERANTPEDFWNPEFPDTLSSTYRYLPTKTPRANINPDI